MVSFVTKNFVSIAWYVRVSNVSELGVAWVRVKADSARSSPGVADKTRLHVADKEGRGFRVPMIL